MMLHGSEDWATLHRKRKFRFAGKAARAQDGRWSHHLLSWSPKHGRGRGAGHPRLRWADKIVELVGGDWIDRAADEDLWQTLEAAYVMGLQ